MVPNWASGYVRISSGSSLLLRCRAGAEIKCKLCLDGFLPDSDFCSCPKGEVRREAEKREAERLELEIKRLEAEAADRHRHPQRPPSIGAFTIDKIGVLHPSEVRQKRVAKPTKKDWADTKPTHEHLQYLLKKDWKDWSDKDRAFLRRLDKS